MMTAIIEKFITERGDAHETIKKQTFINGNQHNYI